ncbi:GFA family protein [Phenylobacterium sp.]|uniref:GFA family protein n=1 Tax=Phenylobacterium sp. TaxID=1871053 RepID=UPI0025D86E95|nr:GFA family protein [Phenylobacterium sp.]
MAGLEGGCACGTVRYRLMSGPMFVHCCHCSDCQRQVGSAFVINALIETDRIEMLSGELRPTAMPTDSGRPHIVYRCGDCGTTIRSDYGDRKVLSFLRATTLDERAALPPDVHIFTRSKLPWVRFPEGARVFEVYYDMAKEWPPESLARREALLGPGR